MKESSASRHGIVHMLVALWPGAALLVGIVAVGFAMRAPAPKSKLAPAPIGWTRFTETGVNVCLAISGDHVFTGGKTGLWRIDRSSSGPVTRIKLPVDPIHVRSLECASDGSLWIGHVDGLIQMKGSAFRQYTKADGLPGSRVNCIREIGGRMMAGTSGGLAELVDGKWVQPAFGGQLASKVVNVICQSGNGDLWVGSSSDPNGGLSRIHGNNVQVWRAKDGLPHPYVQDILPVDNQSVWVATGQFEVGGAVLIETAGGKASIKRRLLKSDGLAGNKVRSLGADKGGALWFGSENDGLAVFGQKNSAVWTVSNGLPHNEVTSIRRDSDGNMWLTTLNGIVRIDRDATGRMAEGAGAE